MILALFVFFVLTVVVLFLTLLIVGYVDEFFLNNRISKNINKWLDGRQEKK